MHASSASEANLTRRTDDSAHAWIATAIAASLALVCTYSVRQADADLFGYLSYGKLFSDNGALVSRDPFAYTSAGFPWVSFEYGAQLLIWWAYRFGGPAGLIALKCVVGGAALSLLYRALREASDKPLVWLPVFLLATSAISRFFLFRPQLFTFAAFAAFVLVLLRYLLQRRSALWVLPTITLVWANLHGGFVAGLGAVGLAILLQMAANMTGGGASLWRAMIARTGRLWATLVGCAAASLVNPHGVRLWAYIVHELTHDTNRKYIAEWAPASFAIDPWSLIVLLLLTTVLVVTAVATSSSNWRHAGPRPIHWALSCVPLLGMSYLSARHLPLAAMWSAPVIVLLASHVDERPSANRAWKRVWTPLSLVSVVPAMLTFALVLAAPQPAISADGRALGTVSPCGATTFLSERHLRGHLFAPLWWGSYITWRLHPDILVSMDGRNVSLYPDTMVAENLAFYWIDASGADVAAPARYDTDFLLVPADVPILDQIARDQRWRPVYRDPDATLFVPASGSEARSEVTTVTHHVRCEPL